MLIGGPTKAAFCASGASNARSARRSSGFTVLELLFVIAVGLILAVMAVPMMTSALASMKLNSAVAQLSSAISSTRYRAIKDSQTYTLALTTPANTFVVTNVGASPQTTDPAVPLPTYVSFTGTSSTITYTLCPNGMVYGSGGTCPNGNAPPSLTASYDGKQVSISVSRVGNVTTTTAN